MVMKKSVLILMAACAVCLSACSDSKKEVTEPNAIVMTDAAPLAKAPVASLQLQAGDLEATSLANEAALKLFALCAANHANDNVVMSPLSVTASMAMIANGAEGSTLSEMVDALWDKATVEQINAMYSKMASDLPRLDEEVTFNNANSMWVRTGYTVKNAYIEKMTDSYRAAVARNVSFGSEASVDAISKWVNTATEGRITDFGKNFKERTTQVALINAIYFKGAWSEKFDKAKTIQGTFTTVKGDAQPAMMMHRRADIVCYDDDNLTMVELSYGKQGKFYLELLLPGSGDLKQLVSKLTMDYLNQIAAKSSAQDVELALPRFSVQSRDDMAKFLQDIGVKQLFTDVADLSGIADDAKLHVSRVMQEATIEVDEEGTVASAATGTDVEITSLGKKISFDRPFMFLLRERESGIILFAGQLTSVN